MENSNIAWTHNTQNFWLGCNKIAPECAHCYIGRTLRQQGREPWGQLYRTKTWNNPAKWQKQAEAQGACYRVFTNSLSDFFHAKADAWREEAWNIIREAPNLIWLILTKRPELVASRLPKDWCDGYPNVWLGTSVGCNQTLNKMDTLRKIPIHSQAVRFVSCEPLLEDIADEINLDGFGWLIAGGESGDGQEYSWDKSKDWRKEFDTSGRRTMKIEWAQRLLEKSRAAGIPYFFKQVTSFRSGVGEDALGRIYHEFPPAPRGSWADKTPPESATPLLNPLSPIRIAKARAVAEVAAREKVKTLAQRQELEEEISSVAGRTAVSDERKTLSKTPVIRGEIDVAKTTDVVSDEKAEVERLKAEANDIASELVGNIHSLGGRLIVVLLRIKEALPHGEWTTWYEEFRKKYSFKSLRQIQRDFKQLTAGDDAGARETEGEAVGADQKEPNDTQAPVVYESPKELLTERLREIRKVLSEGPSPADANPLRDGERRITDALELVESTQLAIDDGLLDNREPAHKPEPCICNRPAIDKDYVPLTLSRLAQILKDVAVELCFAPYHLGGIAQDIDTIREHLEDRMELDRRMSKLNERMSKRPAGWKPNQDMLMLQLRRDRRFLVDMKNIKAAGGTTYRGEKIWGSGDELFIKRYTREDIEWEIDNSEPFGTVPKPEDDERLGHLPTPNDYSATETSTPVSPPDATPEP
jgi:protein gp37